MTTTPNSPYIIGVMYHFADLPDYADYQVPLREFCMARDIRGTLLLAAEGINGSIAGEPEKIEEVATYIRTAVPALSGLTYRSYPSEDKPFNRMKVRLKKEIVTMGDRDFSVDTTKNHYASTQEWEQLLQDPDVVVIDTRNRYEVELGTFKGAVNPDTENFGEFPRWVQENIADKKQKVAMFCTGGIRCEKAGNWMQEQGYENVHQLHGGILHYLQETKNDKQLWEGDCFVFDDRVAVNDKMQPSAVICATCNHPMPTEGVKYHVCPRGEGCKVGHDSPNMA